MKILYITLENLSLHKGSVVHIKEVVLGLQKLGHEVDLVAISQNKFEKYARFYNLHRTPNFLLKLFCLKRQPYIISSFFLFLYLIRILHHYDLIYGRDYHTVIIAYLPSLLFRKKLVFEINGIANEEQKLKGNSIWNRIITFFIKKAEKLALKCSNRIISVTSQIASYLNKHFYCPLDKVEVVSNGVNIRKFHPIKDEALLLDLKKKLGIAQDEIVVIFVGSLARWQGVEHLLRVAPLVIKEVSNIKFLIVGDGVLKKEFEEGVNRLGLSDHFIFTGMVDYEEIPIYINIAEICILLKQRLKSGYSPIKLYEYMACGKPILASSVEGLEFIETEEVGYLVKPDDLISLEETLLRLIKEPQKRINMGEKGFKIAIERFNWDLKVAKIEKILLELA